MSGTALALRNEVSPRAGSGFGLVTLLLGEGEFNLEPIPPDEWLISFVPRSCVPRRVHLFPHVASTQDGFLEVLTWVRGYVENELLLSESPRSCDREEIASFP